MYYIYIIPTFLIQILLYTNEKFVSLSTHFREESIINNRRLLTGIDDRVVLR